MQGARLHPHGTFRLVEQVTPPGFSARKLRVYVPAGPFDEPRPVLFLFDGQNVFGDEGSFSGGWHADRAVDRLVASTVRKPIVVGIDHGGVDRLSELSPFEIRGKEGRIESFLDWVVGDVVPRIRGEYAVLPGAVGACVGGSSMGGLASLYAHFRHPDVFGGALCMSPSFWVGRGALFRWLQERQTPRFSRVYLDAGAHEGGMLGVAERMFHELRARGYPDEQLMWRPDRRGHHSERDWRRRLPKALRFMFRVEGREL